ncbi:hypothetical protein [Acutalibacter caecimuris]|uniref:hypothetical protein n=1 Tax=Acutalibacter caecimuris TaxID=3093657 RepID=UPI002AC97355|nr:hypothetical protein [Acutalibacter sp. M00118]
MDMAVIRYINNEPYQGEKLPAMKVDNPGVVMVLKGLQHRLIDTSKTKRENHPLGKSLH